MPQGTGDRTDEGADPGKEGDRQEVQNRVLSHRQKEGGRRMGGKRGQRGEQWSCYPRSESLLLK